MGFSHLIVEGNIGEGLLTIIAAPEVPVHDDDPYCFQIDLTPAAALELARELNRAADGARRVR
jgi:hypothetical protein